VEHTIIFMTTRNRCCRLPMVLRGHGIVEVTGAQWSRGSTSRWSRSTSP